MAVAGLQGVTDATRKQLEKYQAGYTASSAVNAAQQQMQNAQAAKPGAYTPSAAVTDANTRLNYHNANKPGKYTAGAEVQQALASLNALQAAKPGAYQSKFQNQLDSLMAQIQNPEKFNYEFNGDNLFKAYADMYTQKGKQAAADVQGQAAAMTGGYGNSYGVTAGNQAYQQYLTDLYGIGMDLRDRAYQEYKDKLQNNKDVYGLLQQADESEYGRYRDTVGDWRNDVSMATERYNTERNFDYNKYQDEYGNWKDQRDYLTSMYQTESDRDYNRYRDTVGDWENERNYYTNRYDAERDYDTKMYQFELEYWTGLAEIENADYNSQLEREEAIREYNEKMELERQKLEEDKRRYDQEWAHQLELEEAAAAEASSGSGGNGNNSGNSDSYVRLGDNKYEDKNGNIVDGSKLKDSDVVYEGAYNAVTNAGNAIGNALRSASQNVSDYVKWLLGGGK